MQYLGSAPRIGWSAVTLAAALAAPLATATAQDDGAQEDGREDVPEPPAASTWSMDGAMDRAASAAPSVRAAAARLAIAESHREHAAMPVLRNPIVGVRALFGVPDDAAAIYSFFLGIPFDLSSRQSHRTEETDILLDEADGQLELERIEARARARAAAARVAAGQASLEIARARLVVAERLLGATRERLDSGAATALDHALVEQEVSTAAANVAARRRELAAARDALRAALDLEPTVPVAVEPLTRAEVPAGMTIERAIALAEQRRREPQVLRLSARRHRVSESRMFADSVSPLILSAEYELQTNSQRLSSFGVGASMELPLFWTAQGDRAVALSEADAADVNAGLAGRIAGREAAAAYRALRTSLAELRAVEEQALPASERALELTEALRDAGAAEVFRVLLARQALFELRERRVELLLAAWLARAELDRATGGEL